MNEDHDELTLEMIDRAVELAQSLSPPIQPIRGWRLWLTPYWRDRVTGWPVNPFKLWYLFVPDPDGGPYLVPIRRKRQPGT